MLFRFDFVDARREGGEKSDETRSGLGKKQNERFAGDAAEEMGDGGMSKGLKKKDQGESGRGRRDFVPCSLTASTEYISEAYARSV